MKKSISFILIFSLAFTLCGCKGKKMQENTKQESEIEVNFGCEWNVDTTKDGLKVDYHLENIGTSSEFGMLLFVNGFPQKCLDNSASQYVPAIKAATNETVDKSINYTYVSATNSSTGYARTVRIYEPNKNDVNNDNMLAKLYQKLSGNYASPQNCKNEYSDNIDVELYTGELEKDEYAKTFFVDMTINGSKPNWCSTAKQLEGDCTIQLSSTEKEKYVLSFWGDNAPIKIGEHQYYYLDVDAGNVVNYNFTIQKSDIENINKFRAIVCPTSNSSLVGIEATDTIFISDTYTENVQETANDDGTETKPSQPVDYKFILQEDPIIVNDCFFAYCCEKDNNRIVKYNVETDEIVEAVDKNNMKNITEGGFYDNRIVNPLGQGIIFNNYDGNDNIVVFDSKLNPIYEGTNTGFFDNYNVYAYQQITDKECIALAVKGDDYSEIFVVSKDLSDGNEAVLYASGEHNAFPEKASVTDSYIAVEAYSADDRNNNNVYIKDRVTGEETVFENMSILFFTPDESTIVLKEYNSGWNLAKPYILEYNMLTGTSTRVEFDSEDYSIDYLRASYNGDYLMFINDGLLHVYDKAGNKCIISKEGDHYDYYYPTKSGLFMRYVNEDGTSYEKTLSWSEVDDKISGK